jgi:hypothetical protein
LSAYADDTAKLKLEQADAARQAKYDSNRSLQLAIEHAEGFLGTPPAGADPVAVQTAVAILDAGFADPEVAARTYWAAVADISDAAHQRRASESAAKTAERHKAEAEEARAHVAELESRQQAEQARELAGVAMSDLALIEDTIANLKARLAVTTDRRKRLRIAEDIAMQERQAQRLRDHQGRRGGNDESEN